MSEEANEDMVNAVGVMDGWEGAVTSKSFQGGNVRAVMGGVELDLTDVVIENRPAIIQATIVMGGVLVRVPSDWNVEIEASQTMGGVEDDREHPAFDDESSSRQVLELQRTQIAQSALGAVSLGALRLLEQRFELKPDHVAGHSYGELVALHAAGCFDAEALHELSALRGALMADGSGDRGAMLAVQTSAELLEALIESDALDLVIANRNAPNQFVLSGATEEIERALVACEREDMRATRLPVSAAFHSELVADAARPFAAELKNIHFRRPSIPVYANSTARQYSSRTDSIRKTLSEQLKSPVEFIDDTVRPRSWRL